MSAPRTTMLVFATTTAVMLPPSLAGQVAAVPEQRLARGAAAMVSFQPLNARVEVRGWDRDSIVVEVWGAGPNLRLDAETSRGVLELHERRALREAGRRVTYRLSVPHRTQLRLRMQRGEALLNDLAAAVTVGVTEGTIVARRLRGGIDLSAVTGAVQLDSASGAIAARSVAGAVVLRAVDGRVRASSTSGDVSIVAAAPVVIEAEAYSGTLRFSGEISTGEQSSLATHSGGIQMTLSTGRGTTLFMQTVRGRVIVKCGLLDAPAAGEPLVVGSGPGGQAEIISFSGDIKVDCVR